MLEAAAAICAGAAVSIAALSLGVPAPLTETAGAALVRGRVHRIWLSEAELAASAGWPWLDGSSLITAEAAVAICGAGAALLFTALHALCAELEATVTSAQEVEREAEALQVQARSAAAIIVSLPVVFLLVLTALRSPYLDAYHDLAGQVFLLVMLGVMGTSYLWMRRLLRLDGLQRVRLADGLAACRNRRAPPLSAHPRRGARRLP